MSPINDSGVASYALLKKLFVIEVCGDNPLRVIPAETRLTVYRGLQVEMNLSEKISASEMNL